VLLEEKSSFVKKKQIKNEIFTGLYGMDYC
jgi:hypothetical protein